MSADQYQNFYNLGFVAVVALGLIGGILIAQGFSFWKW